MEKQISIATAASDEVKDVTISPGVTTREVLDEVGLQGYQLSRKGGEPLGPDTDLFKNTSDGEKLFATPEDVSVGEGGSASPRFPIVPGMLSDFIIDRYIRNRDSYKEEYLFGKKRVRVIRVRPFKYSAKSDRVRIEKIGKYKMKKINSIAKKTYPYWKENGWIKMGKTYRGYYKTDYGSCRGLVKENYKGSYSFYIFNPPKALRGNEHWQCFSHKGNGKYAIHFSHKPKDVNSGIIALEQLLRKAVRQKTKGENRCFSNVLNVREYVSNLLRKI